MPNRIQILISIPEDFTEKFINFVNNINAVNSDIEIPIQIIKTHNQKLDFAAVPKSKKNSEETIENKNKK